MTASRFQLRVPFTVELFDAMFVIDSNGIPQPSGVATELFRVG